MFEIEEKIIPEIVIPAEAIGIVIMQPYVTLTQPDPYRWPPDKAPLQIERIVSTLEVAKQAKHGCEKTHFTVFPEYSIPGLRGIARIEDIISSRSWPEGTVVIGGTDWLSKGDYTSLWADPNTEVSEDNKNCRDSQYVNCCITWTKYRNREGQAILKRWLQPKICRNWREERTFCKNMFEGKRIYVFEALTAKGQAFRFMSIVCFDWIGDLGSGQGVSAILRKVDSLPNARPYGKELLLVFVPQRNPEPNHPSFLNNANSFFCSQDYPFVQLHNCVVVFANNAGNDRPGPCKDGKYGYSCLIFSPSSPYVDKSDAPPSYAIDTEILRGNSSLQTCKEALFREHGACVHAFRLHHPLSVIKAPPFTRRPLDPVLVYPIDKEVIDPRATGDQIPAIIKWSNDRLDTLQPYLSPGDIMRSQMERERNRIVRQFRESNEEGLQKNIQLATAGMEEDGYKEIDKWTKQEEQSLGAIIDTLSIIGCAVHIEMKDTLGHAVIIQGKTVFDIIIVKGMRHPDNLQHVGKYFLGRTERQMVIISCDVHDNPMTDRDRPIYEESTTIKYCGLHNLKNFLCFPTEMEAICQIRGYLGVQNE